VTVRARAAPHPGVAGGALGGPVVIPRAKIRTPVARTEQVRRDRLLEPLADAAADLVLVLAPAGFGKTTFIAQWAAQTRNRVAWATVRRTRTQWC
jgi:LuxR family maltose regulon positive regulatory protein